MTNIRLGMLLEVATTVGAVAGGVTAVLIDGRVLQVAFAAVLFYVAWQMNRRGGDVAPVQHRRRSRPRYYDPAAGEDVAYGVRRTRLGFVLCLGAGNISGLLGRRRRRLQGADHEPADGRPAQGDHRHQQPDDRRHGGDQRGDLLRARLHGPVLRGAGGARHPRSARASGRASPCACRRARSASIFQVVLAVFAVLMIAQGGRGAL